MGVPGGLCARLALPVTYTRAEAVWGRLAADAAGQGRRVSIADVCAVAVSSARMGGASLAAARDGEPDFVTYVTDLMGERLAEVQLTLGEGPGDDVLASAVPVLAVTWATTSSAAGGRRSLRPRASSASGRSSCSR
jgi:hypothetical protein